MKPSAQRANEALRQHTEALVTRHVRDMFRRLPMLAGFWLTSNFEAGVAVFTGPGYDTWPGLYEEVMRSLGGLAEERPEAVQLMRGRTFARAFH